MGPLGHAIVKKIDQLNSNVEILTTLSSEEYKRGNFDKSFGYIKTAYKINPRPEIAADLALFYKEGRGVKKDVDKAFALLREAVEKDNEAAKGRLGQMYLEGQGIERDPTKGISLLTEAANHGQLEAMGLLGFAYLTGDGVEKDDARGIALLTEAAEQGREDAQYSLFIIYENGLCGIRRNLNKAIKWASLAANSGYAEATSFLEKHADKIQKGFVEDR